MANPIVGAGASLKCSFGLAPAALIVLPANNVLGNKVPAGTIQDSTMVNVPTFGMCSSPSNPEVAAATAAALGVLTPMPCVPVLTPWVPVSQTLIGGQPALVQGCTAMCGYGGAIEILPGGSATTLV